MIDHEVTAAPGRIEIVGSDGLVLKQYIPEDAQTIYDVMHAAPHDIEEFEPDMLITYDTADKVRESIEHPRNPARLRFGIWDQDEMAGSINITPDKENPTEQAIIGYWVGGEHNGRHLAQRATELLEEYAFQTMKFNRLVATARTDNTASIKALERNGFRVKDVFKPGKGEKDTFHFELTKEEYARLLWR